MAFLQIDFYSESLMRRVTFNALIPNDLMPQMKEGNKHYERPTKTLILLHGYSASNKDWLLGSRIEELSMKYNMAVIFPTGDNSFYLDGPYKGAAYGTYVGQELIAYVQKMFHLSNEREDTFIGGLSMGGFGAIRTGLYFSNTFSKIIGLSSALIIHNIKNKKEDFVDGIANYYYYTSIFGNLDVLEASTNNPETLVSNLNKDNLDVPKFYLACGTEDFLLEENRMFKDYLENEKVDFTYIEDSGTHDWDYWNKHLEPSIKWLLEE